ncbi:S-adenosylmethionine decarboxylase [Candidatus Micrarchaeota archaeon]|nr:S-adenosylmethionine decarboxylase [Candidatus Micrarchaeota archaeon]
MLLGLITAFCTGFLSKLTDVQVDEKRFFFRNFKFATGLAYGVLYALALSLGAEFANLFLGIAIAVLLAGKIDSKAHQFAIAGFLGALVFFGFPQANALLVLAFVVFALLDEFLNDYFDVHPSKGILAAAAKQRLSLEAFALALSIYTGNWVYFAAILSFDLGYRGAEKFSARFVSPVVGAFGTHLVLDLQDCPAAKLSSRKFVLAFLNSLPEDLGMRKISKPVVKEIKTVLDEGLSGFVMIAESHVSIHTFPKFHSAHVDVFSCKPFDAGKARGVIEKRFSAKRSRFRVMERMGEENG